MAVEHGYIPLGKYSSARDSILHHLCLSDWAEESDGNSEAPTGYFWRMSNAIQDVALVNGEFTHVIEDWFIMNPEVTDSEELRAELVGHFIVQGVDSGFVYVGSYDTEADMLEVFTDMQNVFSAWDTEESNEEFEEGRRTDSGIDED